jgi:3-keto-5-aminohexanoate cleavage enzyme
VTAAETARTAAACREAGAAMIHIHVRDENQRHSLDVDLYRDAIAAARREAGPDMVIQATTESVGMYDSRQQMEMVRALKPEAISMGLRELAPAEERQGRVRRIHAVARPSSASPRRSSSTTCMTPGAFGTGRARASSTRARPLCSSSSANTCRRRRERRRTLLPLYQTCAGLFRDWMLCAFGPRETACVATAALLGGHCRVGFENNLHLPDGSDAPDNAAIVRATASALTGLGLPLMGARELRELWNI